MYPIGDRQTLLEVAAESIGRGLRLGAPWLPELSEYSEALREPRASFVTLEIGDRLRGCIGVLEPHRPLVQDVAHNAFGAAFQDPRFPPLRAEEFPTLDIKISVLGPSTRIQASSEAELLAQLRPGVDGLILRDGRHRGTFLPAVWEQLPSPEDFLAHLKRKAGLPPTYWSDGLEVSRYTTESFGGPVPS